MNFCTECTHVHVPRGALHRDRLFRCARDAEFHPVDGIPEQSKTYNCYEERSKEGTCGITGRFFAARGSFNLKPLPDSASLPLDCDCLNESSQQNGIVGGKSIGELPVNFCDGGAHVIADNCGGQDSTIVDN